MTIVNVKESSGLSSKFMMVLSFPQVFTQAEYSVLDIVLALL